MPSRPCAMRATALRCQAPDAEVHGSSACARWHSHHRQFPSPSWQWRASSASTNANTAAMPASAFAWRRADRSFLLALLAQPAVAHGAHAEAQSILGRWRCSCVSEFADLDPVIWCGLASLAAARRSGRATPSAGCRCVMRDKDWRFGSLSAGWRRCRGHAGWQASVAASRISRASCAAADMSALAYRAGLGRASRDALPTRLAQMRDLISALLESERAGHGALARALRSGGAAANAGTGVSR